MHSLKILIRKVATVYFCSVYISCIYILISMERVSKHSVTISDYMYVQVTAGREPG